MALGRLPMQTAETFSAPHIQWGSLTPLLVLLGTGVIMLVAAALTRRGWPRGVYAAVTSAAAITAGILQFTMWATSVHHGPKALVRDVVVVDGMSLFLGIAI